MLPDICEFTAAVAAEADAGVSPLKVFGTAVAG